MDAATASKKRPSAAQRAWLRRGLDQAGGKLPLFDERGRPIDRRTIHACIAQGWAEKWFDNPLKGDWIVCRLTARGRSAADAPVHKLISNMRFGKNVIVLPMKQQFHNQRR